MCNCFHDSTFLLYYSGTFRSFLEIFSLSYKDIPFFFIHAKSSIYIICNQSVVKNTYTITDCLFDGLFVFVLNFQPFYKV